MPASMGYVKYVLVFLISAWMFFLGVLVGRGTAPVSFDTQRLQARLASIAEDCSQRLSSVSKPELVFYEVLKKPARTGGESLETGGEILPGSAVNAGGDAGQQTDEKRMEIKKSRKTLSLKSASDNTEAGREEEAQHRDNDGGTAPAEMTEPVPGETGRAAKASATAGGHHAYTIQVASFKSLDDAGVQMAALEKKGYASYTTMAKIGDAVWVRVRTGDFATRDDAASQLEKMKADGIKGLIIKKD